MAGGEEWRRERRGRMGASLVKGGISRGLTKHYFEKQEMARMRELAKEKSLV